MRTFGSIVAKARKALGLTQRDLAASITREDGEAGISPAYLNDIEHDRRRPTGTWLIREFARKLDLDPEYLLLLAARQMPDDIAELAVSVDQAVYSDALQMFRKALRKKK